MTASSLLLAALVSSAQAQSPPPTAAEEEIVVVGQRLRQLRFKTKFDRTSGTTRCVFKRRSGDAEFDDLMCNATIECAKTVRTRVQMEECLEPAISGYTRTLATRSGTSEARSDP
jgi:hypothetical protein